MPKVMVYKDEQYPVYKITDPNDTDFTTAIELTYEELGKIEAANILYKEAQTLLENKYEAVQEATLPKRRRGDV